MLDGNCLSLAAPNTRDPFVLTLNHNVLGIVVVSAKIATIFRGSLCLTRKVTCPLTHSYELAATMRGTTFAYDVRPLFTT
jgi:hypothetical protein